MTFVVSYTGTFDGDEELRLSPASDDSIENNNNESIEENLFLSVKLGLKTGAPQLTSFTSNAPTTGVAINETVVLTANFNTSMTASPVIIFSSNESDMGSYFMQPTDYGAAGRDAYSSATGGSAGGSDQWQSFTVSNTGRLSKVAWEMSNPVINGEPQPITIKVYRGQGTTGELLAVSENLFSPAYKDEQGNFISSKLIRYDLSGEFIDVTAGEILTMRLSLPEGNNDVSFLPLAFNNQYSGGQAGNDSSWDYIFETHVRPVSNGQENWQYSYTIPDTNASEITATVTGTDIYGNTYSGTSSVTFSIKKELPDYLPTNGLISWYPFNGNANDESGNGDDGLVTGAVLVTGKSGIANSAYRFDGDGDYIDIGPNSSFNLTDSGFSFSFWLNPTAGASQSAQILCHPNNQQFQFNHSPSNNQVSFNSKPNNTWNSINTSLNSGWNHVVGVYDHSTNTMKIYAEGVLVESSVLSQPPNFSSDPAHNRTLLGAILTGGQGDAIEELNAKLDDVGLWSRALSAAEVAQLYTGVIDTVSPTVVLSHDASPTTSVSNGNSITVTATFSEAMTATPTINISAGQATDVAMSATASSAVWAYTWTVSSSVDTEVSVTVAGTDLAGNAYSDTSSLTFSITQELPDYLPTNGLVAWYPFNGNANDESGNSKHGTVLNGPQLTTDRNGNAQSAYDFDWDGITGYGSDWKRIDLDHDFNLGSTFTFNVWINPETYYWTGNNSRSSVILANNADCNDNNFRINLDGEIGRVTSSGTNGFGFQGSVSDQADLNQWQMISVVSDGSNAKIYRNGEEIASSASASYQILGCLAIGLHRQSNGHWYYFDGKIDDVGIWNRALTPTEIESLLNENPTPELSITSSDADNVLTSNSVVSITASFSVAMELSPEISIAALNPQNLNSMILVDNASMTNISSNTVWEYSWTVNTTDTLENVSVTVSGTSSKGVAFSELTTLTFAIDNDAPGVSSIYYNSSTEEVEMTFNEQVFKQLNGSYTASLTTADFSFSLSEGSAILNSSTPTSLTVSGTTYILGVDLSGFISGSERLTITPVVSSIFDAAGNAVIYTENGLYVDLVDNISPKITEANLSNNNSSVVLTFNEEVFTSSMSAFNNATASSTVYSIPTQQTQTSSWDPWRYDFDLNVPEGYIISKITFDFDAVDQGWGGTNAYATIKINSTELGKAQLTHSTQNFTLAKEGSFPDFNYTGSNELSFYFIGWSGWSSTTTNGQLTVYYSPLNIGVADFEFGISGGAATLASNTPSSISAKGNTYALGLNINGIPNGNEVLTVNAVANGIYDSAGNPGESSVSSFTLYDKVASTISSITLSGTNTSVIIQFTEPFNSFSNWNTNEPNDISVENYGMLVNTGKWNDHGNTHSGTVYSIIEFNQITNAINGYTKIGDFNGSSYFKSTVDSDWEDAKTTAESIGGYLAIITSLEEKNFIVQNSTIENNGCWIGLYQDTNDISYSEPAGGWKWLDGTYAVLDSFNLNSINLTINGGTASLTSSTPISLEELDNNRFLIELPIQGSVSGDEVVTIGINNNSLYDAADNIVLSSQANNTVQLLDRSAPDVLLTDDRSDDIFKDGDTVLITATFDEAMTASPLVIFSNSNSSYPMTATNSASVWNYSWVVSSTINESITVSLEGTDLLGNSYAGTDTLSYVIDNSTPTVILSDDQDNRLLRASDTVLIEAAFSESLASTPTIILSDGVIRSTVSLSGSLSDSTWNYSWDVGALDWADGDLSIQILDAIDQGGNAYSGSSSLTFIIDNTAPTLQLSSNRTIGVVKTGDEVVFEALISEALTNPPMLSFGEAFLTQLMNQTASPTIWSYKWVVPETTQESFSATASVTDDAGNNQSTTNSLTFALDNTAAIISEIAILPDNTAVEVTFDDAVYTSFTTGVASGSLEVSDFSLELSGGKATLLSAVPEDITFNNNTYTLFFTTEGAATGSETLNIKVNPNTIFDMVGNPTLSNQVTATGLLNDITAPFITEARVIDEKTLTLTLNEPAFTSDGSLIAAADLMLSLNTGSATLESQTPESLVQEGSTFTISFNLTGSISASQTIRIGLTNPIQDATGNSYEYV